LSGARLVRALVPWLLAVAVLVTLSPSVPAPPALAAESIPMPFTGGKSVRIIQGYNGGTHQGRGRYALDLVLADGDTSGAEVVAPVDGAVTFSQSPKSGAGCIAIEFRNGSYSVMLCHLILNRAYSNGESIARGQSLGTVGAAGLVANNGVPHVHLELHTGSRANSPVPFAEPDGLPLEGVAIAASSTTATLSRREPIVSTNGAGSGIAAPSVAQRAESTQPMSARSAPAQMAAASVPATMRNAQPPSSEAARLAVVQGTDSCLNVRKQPSADGTVVGCLREGSEVALKPLTSGADPKWRQIEQGWVFGEYLKRTQAVVAGTNACLNVRESPKAGAAKLGCLPDGTAVAIAEGPATNDRLTWYRIEPAGSVARGGWVIGQYLD
jgi:hypothetical protein